jgi:hypothetical protein
VAILSANQSLLDRMVLAVELVRQRLMRAVRVLEAAGISYAIAGGNAVAAWVATVDPGAVRNTPDVDLLLRRDDFPAAKRALESAGFLHHNVGGIDMFIDGPNGSVRDAIHLIWAREKVKNEYAAAAPDVTDTSKPGEVSIVALESLVLMKLTSFRLKDRVHLRDLLDLGLIDPTWVKKFPPELSQRLQQLIDTPEE